MLLVEWPGGYGFTGLVVIGVGLLYASWLGGDGMWAYALGGFVLLMTAAWGAWRTWTMRIEISGAWITTTNQIRTHHLTIDRDCSISRDVLSTVFPASIGIVVRRPGSQVRLFPSGFLLEADRTRLIHHLRDIARSTGCAIDLPDTWKPPAGWP